MRSLKHQEEIATLREIYGERFLCIGAHAPREERIRHLAGEIADSHGSTDRHQWEAEATRLAQRDDAEEDHFGQDVRGTFPKADFFIEASHRTVAREQLERRLNAWFGDPFASPTPEEFAMFHAHAAGARSADLSRQVGAAIALQGDIVAVGCNEVPAFGGGAYWSGQDGDARDCMIGVDANAHIGSTAIEEVRNALVRAELIRRDDPTLTPERFAAALENTRVDQLTEFGRAVHAEMAAILDAARRGQAIRGATLYTTTFPCHTCAKHIVGAGLIQVVYIAPYPKSMAGDLHKDSIAIDPSDEPRDKVVFRPFVGDLAREILGGFPRWSAGARPMTAAQWHSSPESPAPSWLSSWDISYLDREGLALVSLSQELERHKVALIAGREIPAPQPR